MPDLFKIHSSRRPVPLKPGDYDHEIGVIDHDVPVSRYTTSGSRSSAQISRVSTTAQLLPRTEGSEDDDENGETDRGNVLGTERNGARQVEERPPEEIRHQHDLPHPALSPTIEVQEPTTDTFHGDHPHVKPSKPRVERETALDILYENERGGFFCGISLFSSAALGGLDVQPWTNAFHRPSATSIHNATVPDPSWTWLWPEWRVNHQEGMDDGGWEYSFAFSNKFSWHKPAWWNSFVRRRAWIRKRVKKPEDSLSGDPHMLNNEYFTIHSASELKKKSRESFRSKVESTASMSRVSSQDSINWLTEITDMSLLKRRLRSARVDREKLEAMENYLDHAHDFSGLSEEMHNIMGLFVFQAPRRTLLSRLTQIYDQTSKDKEKEKDKEKDNDNDNGQALQDREKALSAAIVHADEEIRKLAFWSDVKQMAEKGESRGAVDENQGWRDEWEGLDQSGPPPPNSGKLP